jgi:hypothetical protein
MADAEATVSTKKNRGRPRKESMALNVDITIDFKWCNIHLLI